MIILAIVALSAVVLVLLFNALGGIPVIPSSISQYVSLAITYIGNGCGILFQFCYADVIIGLLTFTIGLTAVSRAYQFAMWVVKKIPMFGVSD